jgi:N-acetylated-alpha-linked acidic dipeptidase
MRSVENLASTSNISLNLDALRNAIGKLQSTSIALDTEKRDAEKKFEELFTLSMRATRCQEGRFKGIAGWIEHVFGASFRPKNQKKLSRPQPPLTHVDLEGDDDSWKDYLALGIHGDEHLCSEPRTRRDPYCLLSHLSGDRGFLAHKFRKAAKRVRRVNQKLIDFERGFISQEGIKDRTWYRHLGVAPGKWLGEFPCQVLRPFDAVTLGPLDRL